MRPSVSASVRGPRRMFPGFLPITSASVYPVMRENPSLTHSIRPSRSVMMTALSVLLATSDSFASSSCAARISVMSSFTATKWVMRPASSFTGEIETASQ